MDTATAGESNESALPPEIYSGLVDTLFGTVGSFVSGIFGGLLVPLIAWFRTGEPIFMAAALALLVTAAGRTAVLVAYKRLPPAERASHAHRWEAAYAIGGVGFMTLVGLTAAWLLLRDYDNLTSLYGVVIVLGCAGSLAGRNAGRPKIVMGQLLGVCAPVALVLLATFDAWYWGLSFIFLLVVTSVRSTTHFLNRMLVTALLSHREAENQGQLLGTALNSMTHGLCMMEQNGSITVVNQRLCDVFGLDSSTAHPAADPARRAAPPGAPEREPLSDIASLVRAIVAQVGLTETGAAEFSRKMLGHANRASTSHFTHQIRNRTFLFRFEPMTTGGCVMVVEDITEARRSAEQLEHLAHFDALTGLANRFHFQKQLETHIQAASAADEAVLLSVDLDRFKEVNDTLGHQMGDKLLIEVARRLQGLVQQGDLVARFGGDEFQILLRSGLDAAQIDAFAGRVVSDVSRPYQIDGHAVSIGASAGIAIAPRDGKRAEDLIKCADLALYSAKAASRGTFRRFAEALDAEAQRKRRIEVELREAIAAGHLEVHYQPAIDVRTGKVTTLEALARWRHPTRGLIPPGEFIPVAEETGLIAEIGEFVLDRCCADALSWPADVTVAVNVSPKQFMLRQDLVGRILAVLGRTGLPTRRLELEITESTLLDSIEALGHLARVGIRISLDDFGTGYSSLSYLRQFKVDKIKIDQSFIKAQDKVSLAIVEAVSFLAAAIGVDLVVEGVETEQQLALVVERRIHLIQGYFFSKPLPCHQVAGLLNRVANTDDRLDSRKIA